MELLKENALFSATNLCNFNLISLLKKKIHKFAGGVELLNFSFVLFCWGVINRN